MKMNLLIVNKPLSNVVSTITLSDIIKNVSNIKTKEERILELWKSVEEISFPVKNRILTRFMGNLDKKKSHNVLIIDKIVTIFKVLNNHVEILKLLYKEIKQLKASTTQILKLIKCNENKEIYV